MENFAHNNVIHRAVSAPGAGKTQAFISQAETLLSAGLSIVLALPTLGLTDSLVCRLPANLRLQVINSTTCDHVASELMHALRIKSGVLLITTHESIFTVPPALLKGWMLVVDELPGVVDFPAFPFEPSELAQLLVNAEELDGELRIREGCACAIETSLATFRAVSAGADRTSMLSNAGACIYECLKNEHPVFIDSKMANGNRYVRSVVESNCWKTFAAADEVHVLAATVQGTLFDDFAQAHGFTYQTSCFTPEFEGYRAPITIYPVMPRGRIFSKAAAQESVSDAVLKHAVSDPMLIDAMLSQAMLCATGTPLLFCNNWASFRWLPKGAVHRCSIDSRGLNDYQRETDAILLFGGNPSPSDLRGLEFLAKKYSRVFHGGFIVTRLLEPSLQAATRTSVRDRISTEPVRLIVQDERVANYLVTSYMPNAVVDWSLADAIPVGEDRRKLEDPRRVRAYELFAQDQKDASIVLQIGVHRNTIPKWRKDWMALQAA